MKNLSLWAKNNPISAIWLIIVGHILLVINSILLGIALYLIEWGISVWIIPILGNLFLLVFFFYPTKNTQTNSKLNFSQNYYWRKSMDFTLIISYAIIISVGMNNFLAVEDISTDQNTAPIAKLIVHDVAGENIAPSRAFTKSTFKKKIREFRKGFKKIIKAVKRGYLSDKYRLGLSIILILLAYTLLSYLLAILTCNIMCSGHPGLGYVVGIGGKALLLTLLGLAIRKVVLKSREKKKKKEKKDIKNNS